MIIESDTRNGQSTVKILEKDFNNMVSKDAIRLLIENYEKDCTGLKKWRKEYKSSELTNDRIMSTINAFDGITQSLKLIIGDI